MAAKANIIIDQGTDYTTTLTVTNDDGTPQNLDGFTAAAQMRKHYTSNSAVSFLITFGSPRSAGQLTLALNRIQTANIADGRYVYDVELTNSANSTSRLVEGIVTVTPQVTR